MNNELDFTKDSELEKFEIKETYNGFRIINKEHDKKPARLTVFQQKIILFLMNVLTDEITFATRLKIGISSCFFMLFLFVGLFKCVSFVLNLF